MRLFLLIGAKVQVFCFVFSRFLFLRGGYVSYVLFLVHGRCPDTMGFLCPFSHGCGFIDVRGMILAFPLHTIQEHLLPHLRHYASHHAIINSTATCLPCGTLRCSVRTLYPESKRNTHSLRKLYELRIANHDSTKTVASNCYFIATNNSTIPEMPNDMDNRGISLVILNCLIKT